MSTTSAFRADAPSVSAGSHETRDYYPNQDPPRPSPHTAPSITPYLGLRARLSQVWINRWTVLLLLILARTLIAISGINSDLDSARREALSACSDVESMGSAMASMPHYMSQGANELAAKGVEKAVNGFMDMTMLGVTGVEEIVVFVVNMMTSTYACLITLAVTGTVNVGIDVIETAQSGLNTTIKTLGNDMKSAVTTFTDKFNSAIDDANSLLSTFGKTITFPSLDLSTELDAFQKIKLPTDVTPALEKIRKQLPTFAEVQNATNSAIRLPFEELKTLMNETFGDYTFDRSVFPVPAKEQLTFCSDSNGINGFFDELVHLTEVTRTIFIASLVTAAVLVCIPMAWREIRRWRIMQERSQLVRSNLHDPMDIVYIVSRPYTSTTGIKVASVFNLNRRQILTRWAFAYATSEAALFVLALALAGLFSVACQVIMLRMLEREVPDLTNQVGAFADKVIAQLNNASTSWALGTNGVLNTLNEDINQNMLGWVKTSTHAINETLNTFINETSIILDDVFGQTVFEQPIKEVLNCLIGLKVASFQQGLTWVSDHAHVDFPSLPSDMFSLGAVASIASNSSSPDDSFLSSPGDQASDKISSAVARFLARIENSIRIEAIISSFVLALYLLVVLIGIIRALTLFFGRDKTRGEGGPAHIETAPDDFRNGIIQNDFHAIPLGEINNNRPYTPAPQYTTSAGVDIKTASNPEDDLADQKIGFAGQRDYNSSLSRQSVAPGRNRIVSSQAELWSDQKR